MVDEAAGAGRDPPARRPSFTADQPQQLVNAAAATLLSQLTHFAGVVMTPKRREASFRHIEFLRLSERRVLLIIVTPEGDVQNRILHTDRPYTQSQLIEATNFFNQHYAGQPFDAVAVAARRGAEVAARGHRRADDGGGRSRRGAALSRRRGAGRHRRAEPAERRRPRVEHGPPAPAVRPVRAEDLAAAPARRLAAGAGRADLHRRRVRARAARRMQRRHRALRGRRRGDRHARRHRPDAHGLRARDPDRRRHRQAAVQRADAAD